MSIRITLSFAAVLSVAAFVGAASGDGHADKAMKAAIDARKNVMRLNSYHLGILGAMAKGDVEYDSATAAAAASNLLATATLDRSVLWVPGSVQGDVPGTRAKAEIWSDAAGFDKVATNLETTAEALVAAAGMDLEALRGAIGPVGKACNACHDDYRGPRN